MKDSNSELESFRQEWRAEVIAKAHAERHRAPASRNIPSSHAGSSGGGVATHEKGHDSERELKTGSREPRSALDHYEQAVESESHGNLAESVKLYRQAFRMDDRVDQLYKTKHFPPSAFAAKNHPVAAKPQEAAPPILPTKTSITPSANNLATTATELILSFSELPIPSALPEIERTTQPSSHFSKLPAEILTSILLRTALLDIPSFIALSLVCKKLCYLVATDETIWKRICLGSEVGFGGMFYEWQCEITGGIISSDADPLNLTSLHIQDEDNLPGVDGQQQIESAGPEAVSTAQISRTSMTPSMITDYLLIHRYQTYHNMFRLRPRIRFNGVYISIITYHRPGQAAVDLVTWNSPVHTVTYFRYLRFYRDGTCISLLTSTEPAEVVSMLTRENLEKYAGGKVEGGRRDRRILLGGDGDTSTIKNVMKNALKGRWHLSSIMSPESRAPYPETSAAPGDMSLAEVIENAEGDCFIETEGVDPKYIYRLELSLKETRARARRNHKLNWKGYWLCNKETDDWGEFLLKNDKSFVFSRVRSYEDS